MRVDDMTCRVLNVVTALQFAVAVGISALWVRSYFVQDGIQVTFRSDMVSAYSSSGTLAGVWDKGLPSMPRSVYIVRDDTSDAVGRQPSCRRRRRGRVTHRPRVGFDVTVLRS
jgi:hypothetical protein